MKIHFLGVGAAADENHTNISTVVNVKGKNILLDCGYSVPHALWQHNPDKDFIDAIWISHGHADHFFGLGPLLIRMKEEKRKKPLVFLTRKELKPTLEKILELAYPGSLDEPGFDIEYVVFEKETNWEGVNFQTAYSKHAVPNKAVRISDGKSIVCYSGDGEFTNETKKLFRNCDFLIHETFSIDQDLFNHGNIEKTAKMAKEAGVKTLACAHISRHFRKDENKIKQYIKNLDVETILPTEGDELEI